MEHSFYKYQGTGNDFIVLDNRDAVLDKISSSQIAKLCHRQFGIGADGLMLLNKKEGYDFEMIYFNADGNPSSMCGNGGRCLVQFAYDMGIVKENYHFLAVDGDHFAKRSLLEIQLQMADVSQVEHHGQYAILNTGSPHYVCATQDVEAVDVNKEGAAIRYSDEFANSGINVNFVQKLNEGSIYVRTYERGVENETLSCGTGVTAAAIVHAYQDGSNEIAIKTPGGNLRVSFIKQNNQFFSNIFLCGPATFVFSGKIKI
jgi:diaminopimelate epimerase